MSASSVSDSTSIPQNTVAVLLAAGGGSRFLASSAELNVHVTHKLLAPLRGRTVFECALSNVMEAGFRLIVVVQGAVSLPIVSGRDANGINTIEIVLNPRWSEGQATSLAVAVDALRDRDDVDRFVVGLGDQPFIPADAWRRVALEQPEAPIAVATYAGKRRNPVRLARSMWDLLPREGDEGAKPVLRSHGYLVSEVTCVGEPADIDTAKDLLRWS
jgi:molybdenum cofactor cytidylyltransferase